MTAADASYPSHYAYPLVTWGSTLLGGMVALVTSVMLNLLGAAVGISAAALGQSNDASASAGIAAIVWVVVANLVALGFGAWVAGRSTANPDHHGGTLQGVAVWAVTSFAVLFIASSAISGLGGAALRTAATASNATIAHEAGRSDAGARAQGAVDDVQAKVSQNAAAIQDAATKAAGATAAAAAGTFLAMVFGLVAAIVGARIGARHPSWADRPRFTVVDRRH
ncbi:MAG: hypothetical protein ACYDD1_10945 [Caulobacteraceae bacterium]